MPEATDPQRAGRQIHRYRGQIARLKNLLGHARRWVAMAAKEGNGPSIDMLTLIDKTLDGNGDPVEPLAWAVYDACSEELLDVALVKPEDPPGVRVVPLYEIRPDG